MLQIKDGSGYWLQPNLNQDLQVGTALAHPPNVRGSIRASQIGRLSFHFLCVRPERLIGLMTLSEQRYFERAATGEGQAPQVFPPSSPIAAKLKELCAMPGGSSVATRLQILQLFLEVFGHPMEPEAAQPKTVSDARDRLWTFLKQTPTADLLHISLGELVQKARCTPRHFSRIFREVVGTTFRNKQAELRMARACKLLATTEYKVVDVALESGYHSLSLFNLMFTRRFGMSPGRWRQQRLVQPKKPRPPQRSLSANRTPPPRHYL